MTRVNVIVEGPTEESFLKNVLAPHLWSGAVYLAPVILGVPGHKGGNVNYARVKKDILLQLKQDRSAYCSTMLDLYGLGAGFPGTPAPSGLSGKERAERIERAVLADLVAEAPELSPGLRLIPYVQPHEYEALLFSDSEALAAAVGRPELAASLSEIRAAFETPEEIDDSPQTAPSKRIRQMYPAYSKVIEGTTAAQAIGIGKMLDQCPHFRDWVERLSALMNV